MAASRRYLHLAAIINILKIDLFHESCLDDLVAVNQFDEIVA